MTTAKYHGYPDCDQCVFWREAGLCGHERALITWVVYGESDEDGQDVRIGQERVTRAFMRNNEGPFTALPAAPRCYRGRLFEASE